MILDVSGIDSGYGELGILRDVSFEVDSNELVSIIGPNGAGKTTLMRTVVGRLAPTAGSVALRGEIVTMLPLSERVERGLVLVPEERHLFREMTVRENLTLGSYTSRAERDRNLERVFDLFPRLDERQNQRAGTLSGGEAQMLTIGRGLMADPAVLLLDEPTIGLAPKLVPELFEKVAEINGDGVAVVLVEQRIDKALEVADRGYLLEDGRMQLGGPADELLRDSRVIEKYLGGE